MAKKLARQVIPGTQAAKVREAANAYVAALTDLIKKMRAAGVVEILINDKGKRLVLTRKNAVKIKEPRKP